MLYDSCYLILMFLVYSFIGYIIEVLFCSYHENRLVINRGFLIGPWLPIYGSSVVLIYLLLHKYENDILALFIMSMFTCSVVEFFTSLVLEKTFKIRWWDYSKHKFNLDGRICLTNSIYFGLGGIALFYLFNPVVFSLFNLLSHKALIIITNILSLVFIGDLITSISVLVKLKVSSIKFSQKDVSEEVIKLRNEALKKNSLLLKRLMNAFPKVEGKNKEIFIELKKKVNDIRNKKKKI